MVEQSATKAAVIAKEEERTYCPTRGQTGRKLPLPGSCLLLSPRATQLAGPLGVTCNFRGQLSLDWVSQARSRGREGWEQRWGLFLPIACPASYSVSPSCRSALSTWLHLWILPPHALCSSNHLACATSGEPLALIPCRPAQAASPPRTQPLGGWEKFRLVLGKTTRGEGSPGVRAAAKRSRGNRGSYKLSPQHSVESVCG